MGTVTKESLLLVTLWVAMVIICSIQGASSITFSIEGVCDVVFVCVFLDSLHVVYDLWYIAIVYYITWKDNIVFVSTA